MKFNLLISSYASEQIKDYLDYLKIQYDIITANKILKDINDIFLRIEENPYQFPLWFSKNGIHVYRALIHKRNLVIFFKIRNNDATVEYFYSAKQNYLDLLKEYYYVKESDFIYREEI